MMEIFGIRPFDMHCHVGRWKTEDFCGRSTGLEDLTTLYEGLGFDGALVTTTDEGLNSTLAMELRAYKGKLRLKFAFWVQPDNLNELKDLAPMVSALKVHPSFLRTRVTDPVFRPFLNMAAENGWPVVVHCGRWQEVAGYNLALDVAKQYPTVSFVLSHMGGDAPCLVHATVDRIKNDGLTNAFLGTESIRQFDLIEYAVRQLGANHVVFGSDYNLNSPSAFVGVIMDTGLQQAVKKVVLHDNALKLLGL